MTPAERTAKVAELRAEADRLEREGRRNWPEKAEAGMLFAWGSIKYILSPTANLDEFVLVNLEDGNRHANPSKDPFYYGTANYTYLGHACDLLTIKTPDEEPTGAELVGKMCEFSDGDGWSTPSLCTAQAKYRAANGMMWIHARVYREDRP